MLDYIKITGLDSSFLVYVSRERLEQELQKLEEDRVVGLPVMMFNKKPVFFDFNRREYYYHLKEFLKSNKDNNILFILDIIELQTFNENWFSCFDIKIVENFDQSTVQLNLEAIRLYNNILIKYPPLLRAILNNPNNDYIPTYIDLGIYGK